MAAGPMPGTVCVCVCVCHVCVPGNEKPTKKKIGVTEDEKQERQKIFAYDKSHDSIRWIHCLQKQKASSKATVDRRAGTCMGCSHGIDLILHAAKSSFGGERRKKNEACRRRRRWWRKTNKTRHNNNKVLTYPGSDLHRREPYATTPLHHRRPSTCVDHILLLPF